jgi:hypothetical protein
MAAVLRFCLSVGLIPCLSLMTMRLYSYHQHQHHCCYVSDVRSANLGRAAPLCNDVCLCYTGTVCLWQIVPKSFRQCTSSPPGNFVLDSQFAVPVVSTFCKLLAHRSRLCFFFSIFCFYISRWILLFVQFHFLHYANCVTIKCSFIGRLHKWNPFFLRVKSSCCFVLFVCFNLYFMLVS